MITKGLNAFRFFTGWKIFLYTLTYGLFFALPGCYSKRFKFPLTLPAGYDLNKPIIYKLPPSLDEISGVVYYPKDSSVFAIHDERGWLHKIFVGREKMDILKWKYAAGADFEDVALVDSTFYVLKSNGTLFSFRFYAPDSIPLTLYKIPLAGPNEFESLYWDKDRNQLILLCKACTVDDNNSLSSWAFDLSSHRFLPKPAWVMDVRKIEALMNEKGVKFKPSAVSINPLTGDLFIISSINKLLVVADKEGNPKKAYRINPKLYKQPEGLSFTPRGDLIIANESADIWAANILFIIYKKGS